MTGNKKNGTKLSRPVHHPPHMPRGIYTKNKRTKRAHESVVHAGFHFMINFSPFSYRIVSEVQITTRGAGRLVSPGTKITRQRLLYNFTNKDTTRNDSTTPGARKYPLKIDMISYTRCDVYYSYSNSWEKKTKRLHVVYTRARFMSKNIEPINTP